MCTYRVGRRAGWDRRGWRDAAYRRARNESRLASFRAGSRPRALHGVRGMLGSAGVVSYASGKGGLIGLMRTLAQVGEPHGITVNSFCPSAFSRLVGNPAIRQRAGLAAGAEQVARGRGTPEEVVPPAIFLVHESCTVTNEIVASTGTNVSRLFLASTRGYTGAGITPETVRNNWQTSCDEAGYFVPRSTAEYKATTAELSLNSGREL